MLDRLYAAAFAVAFLSADITASPLAGQDFPTRPVTIIVASTAGGGTDIGFAIDKAVHYEKIKVPLRRAGRVAAIARIPSVDQQKAAAWPQHRSEVAKRHGRIENIVES